MKQQVVKTNKGYVVISEEIPKQRFMKTKDEGKWALHLSESWIGQLSLTYGGMWRIEWKVSDSIGYLLSDPHSPENYRMIVATDTTFKLEGIAQFELPAILDGGESTDLIELAETKYPYIDTSIGDINKVHNIKVDSKRIAFIQGYKAAQEKGCYTEEDLRKAINEVFNIVFKNSLLIKEDSERITYDVINSLKQPKKLVAIEVDTTAIAGYTQEGDTCVKEMFKMVKSEQYPDGLLTIKQYFYE